MIDLYHSRRTNFKLCTYWIRDERTSVGNLSMWILKEKPQGQFYARVVNDFNNQQNVVGNSFMFDKNSIVLFTSDEVDDISRGCVVLYNGKPWMVDNVSREIHLNESEFSSCEDHYNTFITLRS